MPKLIKDGQLVDDAWTLLRSDEEIDAADFSQGKHIVPLATFLKLAESEQLSYDNVAVWLASGDNVDELQAHADKLSLVAVDFPAFPDGRGFSHARSMREYYDFSGEIRAIGNFIQDQMFYLSRCGVNAFQVAQEANIESMLNSLKDFSESYQACIDEPQPLFRRRA